MIRELLLVHHSHTDLGYTHPQPVVMELHRRFIDQALDLIDKTADWPEGSRFKWTCEVSGTTLDWWHQAGERQRQRFLAAVAAGQLEVAGLGWNMTPLMDHTMLLEALEPVRFFRALGVPVHYAMNTDVNGLPWGVVDALLDHGVRGLSMSINEHFGHAPQPRPRAFFWESPSGRKLLAYNGLIYGSGVEYGLKLPVDIDAAKRAIPERMALWESRGWALPFLMMQVTNRTQHDNAPPDPDLCRFIRRWNDQGGQPRLALVTLREFFARLEALPDGALPSWRGDWSDWWNFGSGSTAFETALALTGQRALREAQGLRCWPRSLPHARWEGLEQQAKAALMLFAEHTWGADCAIIQPEAQETRVQFALKAKLASEGVSLARMLRRDGLEDLARLAGGEEMHALFFNPLPYPVRRVLRVPREGAKLEFLTRPQDQAWQRQNGSLNHLEEAQLRWVGPVMLPALGYAAWPLAALEAAPGDVFADDKHIGNACLQVDFDSEHGGIRSLKLDGQDYVRASTWTFGQPVLERPLGGHRHAIFGPADYNSPDIHRSWHPDWQALREGPEEIRESRFTLEPSCASYTQVMRMSSGDEISATYRVFAEGRSLELDIVVHKAALADPHALYLALPCALGESFRCHFETAGAVVELDAEQLPYSNRHFVTTQRWLRLQGERLELTVACPDLPLWQVGGFTFGRHQRGQVPRPEPFLAAWLSNNYWDTNFRADQSGLLRFRLTLMPRPARPLADAIREAVTYSSQPQLHLFRERGPKRHAQAQLLELDLAGALLTGLQREGDGLVMQLMNPSDDAQPVRVAPGILTPRAAWQVDLAGKVREALPCIDGEVKLELPPRAWLGLRLLASP